MGNSSIFSWCYIRVFIKAEKQNKTKILLTITPIVLYFPFVLIFLYLYNYSTQKTILIPENFHGILRIIYEEKCGNHYEEINGTKTLIFPENGILVLNEDFDQHVNYHYYLVDKMGNRTVIPQEFYLKDSIEKKTCVIPYGSGTMAHMIDENKTSQEQKGITFSDFCVYNNDTIEIDREDFKYQEKINSLTIEIVNHCRKQQ